MTDGGVIDAGRRSFNRWALAPSLVVLVVIAGLPALYLIVVSLTPFQLVKPGSASDFSAPLPELSSARRRSALPQFAAGQAKLSFWGVLLQVLFGMLLALLLHTSRFVEFARTFS